MADKWVVLTYPYPGSRVVSYPVRVLDTSADPLTEVLVEVPGYPNATGWVNNKVLPASGADFDEAIKYRRGLRDKAAAALAMLEPAAKKAGS